MTEKNKFKKLPSIKNLSIPQHSSNDAPYSPGYKRLKYSYLTIRKSTNVFILLVKHQEYWRLGYQIMKIFKTVFRKSKEY